MFAETEVPVEGERIPVKANATGIIAIWYYKENEKLEGKPLIIHEGGNLCLIEVRVNGSSRFEEVEAPVTGRLVKIIKRANESVKEGETIGEMKPIYKVPPELREEFYDSIG